MAKARASALTSTKLDGQLPAPPPTEGSLESENSLKSIGNEDSLVFGLYHAIIDAVVALYEKAQTVAGYDERSLSESSLNIEQAEPPLEQDGKRRDESKQDVLTDAGQVQRAIHSDVLADIAARLRLWDDAITSGKAEASATSSPDLYRDIVELLRDCGQDLQRLRIVYSQGKSQTWEKVAPLLKFWLDKAEFALTIGFGSTKPNGNTDSFSINACGERDATSTYFPMPNLSEVNQDFLIESLNENVLLLMDLLPSINNFEFSNEQNVHAKFIPFAPFGASTLAQPFIQKIAENYKNAPLELVERLGEANWQRSRRLRLQQERRLIEELSQAKSISKKSVSKPRSIFHDSAIGTSLGQNTDGAQTVASSSSFAVGAVDDTHHFNCVPPEPSEVALQKPFNCPICDVRLVDIRGRIDWKSHVFHDLKPYICLFGTCNVVLNTFSSRKAWSEHDFTEHRQEKHFECRGCQYTSTSEADFRIHVQEFHSQLNSHQKSTLILTATRIDTAPVDSWKCHLCNDSGFPTRRKFTSHVCAHMEDIALSTLPHYLFKDDEADGSSDDEYLTQHTACPTMDSSVAEMGFSEYKIPQFENDKIMSTIFKPIQRSLENMKLTTKGNIPNCQARANALCGFLIEIGNFISNSLGKEFWDYIVGFWPDECITGEELAAIHQKIVASEINIVSQVSQTSQPELVRTGNDSARKLTASDLVPLQMGPQMTQLSKSIHADRTTVAVDEKSSCPNCSMPFQHTEQLKQHMVCWCNQLQTQTKSVTATEDFGFLQSMFDEAMEDKRERTSSISASNVDFDVPNDFYQASGTNDNKPGNVNQRQNQTPSQKQTQPQAQAQAQAQVTPKLSLSSFLSGLENCANQTDNANPVTSIGFPNQQSNFWASMTYEPNLFDDVPSNSFEALHEDDIDFMDLPNEMNANFNIISGDASFGVNPPKQPTSNPRSIQKSSARNGGKSKTQHKQVKKHVCPQCGPLKAYTRAHDLDRHFKTSHGIIPEGGKVWLCQIPTCSVATKVWARLDNFKQHVIKMHGSDYADQVENMAEEYHFERHGTLETGKRPHPQRMPSQNTNAIVDSGNPAYESDINATLQHYMNTQF